MFKDTVVISGECINLFNPVLAGYQSCVSSSMDFEGKIRYECTITSANDGVHSENSVHYKNNAIDVRTKDIVTNTQSEKKFFEAIILQLGEHYKGFVFILHLYDGKDHLHIQHGRGNIISFDSAIGENKNVFIK